MRILALSNVYPPHYIGGYELGCQRVLDELGRRGHEVAVLTSTHGVEQPTTEGTVHRLLSAHHWTGHIPRFTERRPFDYWWELGRLQLADAMAVQGLFKRFRPDVITVWGVLGLSSSVLGALYWPAVPKVHAISDFALRDYLLGDGGPWVSYWRRRARSAWKSGLKQCIQPVASWFVPTRQPAMDWRNAFFTSARLRQLYAEAGLPVAGTKVIYWGVPIERFDGRVPNAPELGAGPVRLLYAGQLVEHKGVHTLLAALALLGPEHARSVRVSIAGRITAGDPYHERLRALAAALGGDCVVDFLGHVPAEEMPAVLRSHDVLVFPSVYEEPFSIVVLEAMAAGLCVVGTTTGGSAEIFRDGENSLTFPARDAEALASQLRRVVGDQELRRRLAAAGMRQVQEQYSHSAKVDEVEALLHEARSSNSLVLKP
jgi:glycosyltransferase involved in cell wall biosynthesis